MTVASSPVKLSTFQVLTLGTFVGSVHLVGLLLGFTAWRLWAYGWADPAGLSAGLFLVTMTVLPLDWTTGPRMRRFVRWICGEVARHYFPVNIIVEDAQALRKGQGYMMGFEPHSALPLGIPIVFATDSPLVPEPLQGAVHGMASSICFVVPLVRQLWWGLGLRPVSRHMIDCVLGQGKTVVLCPGGVQEILFMDHESETVFLTRRTGFVKLALKHGAPLIPVFVFGQTATYNWYRPGPDKFVRWLSRQIGVVPLAMWGRWGSPIPERKPMHCVIGKPIQVPHLHHPSHEEVAKYLDMFIGDLKALIEKHKAACGFPDLTVRIL